MAPQNVRDSLSAVFLGAGLLAAVTLLPVLPMAHLRLAMLAAAASCVLAGHAIGRRL
jgi:hypothetical protein